MHKQADRHIRLDPLLLQMRGQRVRAPVQFSIGQLPADTLHRHGVRRFAGLCFKQLMNAAQIMKTGRLALEFFEAAPVGIRQNRLRAERLIGARGTAEGAEMIPQLRRANHFPLRKGNGIERRNTQGRKAHEQIPGAALPFSASVQCDRSRL